MTDLQKFKKDSKERGFQVQETAPRFPFQGQELPAFIVKHEHRPNAQIYVIFNSDGELLDKKVEAVQNA